MDREEGRSRQGGVGTVQDEDIFCCDSDSIINLRDAGLLRKLRRLVQRGKVKIAAGVFRELNRKTDKLAKTLQKWQEKYGFITDLDHGALTLLPQIERKYGPPFKIGGKNYRGFWKSVSGRKSIDAQVVALAKSRSWIVVSNDDSVHGACMLEDVTCRRWEEIGRLLVGPKQLSMF